MSRPAAWPEIAFQVRVVASFVACLAAAGAAVLWHAYCERPRKPPGVS